jgi:hypothetical protein
MAPTDKQKLEAALRRPQYHKQQLLTAEQLQQAQHFHTVSLRRALHGLAGEGVVYGYAVYVEAGQQKCSEALKIGCGLALDRYGRQLFWSREALSITELAGKTPHETGKYTLHVHYAERRHTGLAVGECDEHVQWLEEGVVFTLASGCVKPAHRCLGADPENPCIDRDAYVCRHIDTSSCLEAPGELCPTGEEDWWYDPAHGVPLACVELCALEKACESPFGFRAAEPCEARQIVYRNPLLFELIQACHIELARVESLSFQDWLERGWAEPVAWVEFAKRLVTDGVTVRFTKPIKQETLHPGSVFLSASVREQESYFQDLVRMPTQEMKLLDPQGDSARGVHLTFPKNWIERQINDEEMSRFKSGAIVEFTVRGALLRDACGRMLDGRPLRIPDEPAQAMPGGDFVVTFPVEPIASPGQQAGYSQPKRDDTEQKAF